MGTARLQSKYNPRQAWTIFLVVYLASTVAPFNQFKVPPLIPVLLRELQLTEVQAGLLMSSFSLSGLIFAFPAGLLFRRFGPRLPGTIAVGSTALGAALGAVAPDAFVLLLGRLLEGVGMGMTAVFALVTIAAWFPPERRGLPIGIFTSWVPFGQVMMFLVAPRAYELWGWRGVWWIGSGAAFTCAALFVLLVHVPAHSQMARPSAGSPPFSKVLREPGPWLLAMLFGSFHASRVGFATWTPTYLVTAAGWSLADASFIMGLQNIPSLPISVFTGWIMDRIGSRRRVYTGAILLSLPAFALAYFIHPSLMVVVVLWLGLLGAAVPSAINAATPESVKDPSLAGPAAGVVAIGRNAGQLMGPLVLAPIVQAGLSWNWVGVSIVAVSALGLLAGLRARVD